MGLEQGAMMYTAYFLQWLPRSIQELQLTLEKHGFELGGPTCIRILKNKYSWSIPGFTSADSSDCRWIAVFSVYGWESTDVEG